MSRPERILHPERSDLDRFGYVLRKWRKRRGLSLARLAARVNTSKSHVQLTEVAERNPTYSFARDCEAVLDADGEIMKAWKDFAEPYDSGAMEYTEDANVAHGVPGTLGTIGSVPVDAAEVIVIPCQVGDGRITLISVPRRSVLLSGIGAIVGAAAKLPVPDKSSPSAIIPYLLSGGINPTDRWQHIWKLLCDSADMSGPRPVIPILHQQIDLMMECQQGYRGADQARLFRMQAGFADTLSWQYQDVRNYRDAQYWLDRALDWSHAAGDTELVAVRLSRKSELAIDMGRATDAVGAAEAAIRIAEPHTPTAVIASSYAAHGYALQGQRREFHRAHERALMLYGNIAEDRQWEQRVFYSLATFQPGVWQARGLSALGDYRQAASAFGVVAAWPTTIRVSQGVNLARKACAHARAGDVAEAIATGTQSLAIGTDTSSARNAKELDRLNGVLSRWESSPGVAELRTAIRDLVTTTPGATT